MKDAPIIIYDLEIRISLSSPLFSPLLSSSSSFVLSWLLICKDGIRASQLTNVNKIHHFSCFPCKSKLLLHASFADQSLFFKLPLQIKASS